MVETRYFKSYNSEKKKKVIDVRMKIGFNRQLSDHYIEDFTVRMPPAPWVALK